MDVHKSWFWGKEEREKLSAVYSQREAPPPAKTTVQSKRPSQTAEPSFTSADGTQSWKVQDVIKYYREKNKPKPKGAMLVGSCLSTHPLNFRSGEWEYGVFPPAIQIYG